MPRCRFRRGDGEEKAAARRELRPLLFVDFDRTMCATRGGAAPTDAHAADAELLRLARRTRSARARRPARRPARRRRVSVITRNAHRAEIRAWLDARGAPSVAVHCVGRRHGTTKADVILAALDALGDGGGLALFVDDSIDEHVDARLRGCERLHRVLFVRGA